MDPLVNSYLFFLGTFYSRIEAFSSSSCILCSSSFSGGLLLQRLSIPFSSLFGRQPIIFVILVALLTCSCLSSLAISVSLVSTFSSVKDHWWWNNNTNKNKQSVDHYTTNSDINSYQSNIYTDLKSKKMNETYLSKGYETFSISWTAQTITKHRFTSTTNTHKFNAFNP